MRREAAAVFEQLGVRLDPDRIARGLSIADQQLVEIAKALTHERARDRDGRADGGADDARRSSGCSASSRRCARAAAPCSSSRTGSKRSSRICQRVTVMRDGRHVLTKPIEELTTQSIIRAMVGRDMDALFPKVPSRARARRAGGRPADARGRLHRRLVRRAQRRDRGARGARRRRAERGRPRDLRDRPLGRRSVEIDGRSLPPGSPTAAMAAGDRARARGPRQQGLVMDFSIERNIALASLGRRPAGRADPARRRAPVRAGLGDPAAAQVRQA